MTRPLSELRGPVRALFSDVDGTMTTGERIEAATYEALERLGEAGIPVIMVTGRPAGWGQAFMKMTPVLACVAENGGVMFVREGRKLDYLILANGLSDEAAYEAEKAEIANAPDGQLWNLHSGGSGGDRCAAFQRRSDKSPPAIGDGGR